MVIPESVKCVEGNAFESVNQIIIKDIGLLKSGDKPAAVAGFATCPSEYSEKQTRKYIAYIKKIHPNL